MTGRRSTPVCGSRGIFTPDERHTTHAGAVQSSNLASKPPHWLAKLSDRIPRHQFQPRRFAEPVHGAQQDGALVAHRRKWLEWNDAKLQAKFVNGLVNSLSFEPTEKLSERLALDAHRDVQRTVLA